VAPANDGDRLGQQRHGSGDDDGEGAVAVDERLDPAAVGAEERGESSLAGSAEPGAHAEAGERTHGRQEGAAGDAERRPQYHHDRRRGDRQQGVHGQQSHAQGGGQQRYRRGVGARVAQQ
jgi:hypothetical protein